ncbi:MAG: hypothetical protein K2K29_00530 [Muribaculaceae bacterium]|nr:hypothetical protein [Muribaculaceae bacterium]
MRQIYTKLLLALVFAVSSVAICRAEGPRSTTPADGETIFASDTNPLRSIIIACPYDEPSDYASPLPNGGNATLSKDGTVIQTLPVSQAEGSKVMNHYFEVTYNLLEGGSMNQALTLSASLPTPFLTRRKAKHPILTPSPSRSSSSTPIQ